jgi:hypothetical protein
MLYKISDVDPMDDGVIEGEMNATDEVQDQLFEDFDFELRDTDMIGPDHQEVSFDEPMERSYEDSDSGCVFDGSDDEHQPQSREESLTKKLKAFLDGGDENVHDRVNEALILGFMLRHKCDVVTTTY